MLNHLRITAYAATWCCEGVEHNITTLQKKKKSTAVKHKKKKKEEVEETEHLTKDYMNHTWV